MAGVALILDFIKKSNSGYSLSSKSVYPCGLLSATAAATIAAAASRPFSSGGIFSGTSVAWCDAGVAWTEDQIPSLRENVPSGRTSFIGSVNYATKEYPIQLKPLFSAFGLKSFAITSLRSLVVCYLPLLENHFSAADEDDFEDDPPKDESIDFVAPFKKSLRQIARESSVVTTRRMFERLAVHYVSRRMAWKLLKDASRSAKRKALRRMPVAVFIFSVGRTTFKAHCLALAASWTVQVGIDVYRCLIRRSEDEIDADASTGEKLKCLRKKVSGATVRCGSSLVFASLGAGLLAYFHPSIGQWIGCALGEFGGPTIVSVCCKSFLDLEV
ncbi:isopentenyl-diphosphate delta-isomerase [Wolffia australiana]